MGRYMAAELLDSDFFEGVDVIIPIPLHKKKQQFRDYNQSECIARGIEAVMGIAVCVESISSTPTSEAAGRIRRHRHANPYSSAGRMWMEFLN